MLASDSPWVRVWKPKPIGKATLTTPWNLQKSSKQRTLPVILRRRRLARRGLRGLRRLCRPLLVGNRQQQLRVVIDDAVDARGNLVPGELALSGPVQQRHDVIGVVRAAVEPAFEFLGRDRHGHTVMQRG